EIADFALAIFADGKRASGITRNMPADNDSARFFAPKLSKDLRALAIKSFAEFDIRWDRILPPVTFYIWICSSGAHDFAHSVIHSMLSYFRYVAARLPVSCGEFS